MPFAHHIAGGDPHPHDTVDEARKCEDEIAEAYAEHRAENAWLRPAEAGTPDTWRETELAGMSAAYGLPVPPGFH